MIRKSENAKPCPHCGSDKINEVVDDPSDDCQYSPIIGADQISRAYNIHCDICGSFSPHITAWNSRYPDEVHPIIRSAKEFSDNFTSCPVANSVPVVGVANACRQVRRESEQENS